MATAVLTNDAVMQHSLLGRDYIIHFAPRGLVQGSRVHREHVGTIASRKRTRSELLAHCARNELQLLPLDHHETRASLMGDGQAIDAVDLQ